MILQGDKDDIVPQADVERLVEKMVAQNFTNLEYELFRGADHYFRNQLDDFEQTVSSYLHRQMSMFMSNRQSTVNKKRRQLVGE